MIAHDVQYSISAGRLPKEAAMKTPARHQACGSVSRNPDVNEVECCLQREKKKQVHRHACMAEKPFFVRAIQACSICPG